MINNNGIINIGNNNQNTVNNELDYNKITQELIILSKYINEDITNLLTAAKEKNLNKLIYLLESLKKESLNLIKRLGLFTLEKIIEKYILF